MTGMPSSGDQIGPYQVTAVLGFTERGGVFNAWHTTTQREVALAVLEAGLASDDEARRQFFAEVKDLVKVRHENLVEVLDIDEGPAPWFAVELLRGIPLSEFVRRAGRLPLAAALHVAWQLCQGLRAAHETGLVHRALRFDSVFLVEQAGAADVVKVVGFMAGSPVGIEAAWPAIAPEQWRDEFVDHRADFYSLGALLYELTTGRRPIQGQTRDELRANHERASVVPPSTFSMTMPPALDALIVQCLAKDPEDRPYMIQEIEAALRDVAGEVAPYQPRPGSDNTVGVAIPGVAGWNVVAVPARTPTWTASSPPAPAPVPLGDADEPEALEDADVADLEEAEPLATPWPGALPPPAQVSFSTAASPAMPAASSMPSVPAWSMPATSPGGLAALAAVAMAPAPAATAAPVANPFAGLAVLVPGAPLVPGEPLVAGEPLVPADLLKDIAAAVDDATEAPEPPATSSVFDLFADDAPLVPSAPAVALPGPATFELVEQAPALKAIEPTPLVPAAFTASLTPAVVTPPVVAVRAAITPTLVPAPAAITAPPPPEPMMPALRPAMGPRAGVIAAAVVAAQKEAGPLPGIAGVIDEAPLAPAAPQIAPFTSSLSPPAEPAPSFTPSYAPSVAPSFTPAPVLDTPPVRSRMPLIAAAAAVVVVLVGAAVLLRGGDEPTTVAAADPTGAEPTPTPAPTPEPAPVEVAPVAVAPVVDAGVDPAAIVDAGSVIDSADAGAAVVAAAIPEPAPGGDVFGFPDEPGNAPPPAATTTKPPKPTATQPAATKPPPKSIATKPATVKPPPPKPVKPPIKPTPKPAAGKDTLKDGGLVNPFKR